jgi:vacuolar-type H+-ATPase subunit E/Vma4
MSLDKVHARIIEKANLEASKIIEEAKADIDKEIENFRKEQELKFEEAKKKFFIDLGNQLKVKLDVERINLERADLIEEREILEALFRKVEEELLSINSDQYFKFLSSLLKKDIPAGKSTIFLNKKDLEAYGKKLSNLLKKELGKNKGSVISEQNVDIKGGCIIKSEEVEINDSIEVILEDLKEKYEIEISKELFKENG